MKCTYKSEILVIYMIKTIDPLIFKLMFSQNIGSAIHLFKTWSRSEISGIKDQNYDYIITDENNMNSMTTENKRILTTVTR